MSTVKVVTGVANGVAKTPLVSKAGLLRLTAALKAPEAGVGADLALRSLTRAPKIAREINRGDA